MHKTDSISVAKGKMQTGEDTVFLFGWCESIHAQVLDRQSMFSSVGERVFLRRMFNSEGRRRAIASY